MNDEINIKIFLNGVSHDLSIDPKLEPNFRKAAKVVNNLMDTLKSKWRLGTGDYMTFIAFILAYQKVSDGKDIRESAVMEEAERILNELKKKDE